MSDFVIDYGIKLPYASAIIRIVLNARGTCELRERRRRQRQRGITNASACDNLDLSIARRRKIPIWSLQFSNFLPCVLSNTVLQRPM